LNTPAAEEMPPVSLGWEGIQEQTVSSCALGLEAGKADNDFPRLFRLSAVTSAIWIIIYDLGQNTTVYHSLLKWYTFMFCTRMSQSLKEVRILKLPLETRQNYR
jgi:hypothetical protein